MILVYKNSIDAILPRYSTNKSACFDIHACLVPGEQIGRRGLSNIPHTVTVTEDRTISVGPHQRILIPTGLIFHIPENSSLRLHPRSGLAFKDGISLANCEGVVDEDYTEPVFIALINNSAVPFMVKHGDRICQAEVVIDARSEIKETDIKPTKNSNRVGGFGSTGK